MSRSIPALSIRQPWTYGVMRLGKDIENRTWPTERRGRVWVHAGKSMGSAELQDYTALRAQGFELPPFEELPRGCIVGHVEIVDCVEHHASPWKQEGTFGFVLRDPVLLQSPVPCPGMLNFFNLHPAIRAKLAEQLPDLEPSS